MSDNVSSRHSSAAVVEFKELFFQNNMFGKLEIDHALHTCSVATNIAARGPSTFSLAGSILFQLHAPLLVTNNAVCLLSGLLSDI